MGRKFIAYLKELRSPFFIAVIIPVILGTIMAWKKTGAIHWGYFWLALIGAAFLNGGINTANDYFDHKSGNDEANKEYVGPFTGGSRLIQEGLLSPREVFFESMVCFAAAVLIGLYLTYQRGFPILWVGLIGAISGFFYTAPPFYWAKRGVGELLVGLNCGILICLGAYYVQAQSIDLLPVIPAIPIGLLITAVLYINEFPDYEADKSVGKNNIVVRLGRERAVKGYNLLIISVYVAIIAGVALRMIPVIALFSFLTLPLAIKSIGVLKKYYAEPAKLLPANMATINLHLIIGIILNVSYFLA